MPATDRASPRLGWRGCGKAWRGLTPRFSANRAVREYTEQHYLPAAATYRERAADKGAVGRNIVNWEHTLKEKWATLRFGDVKVQTNAAQHIFEAEVLSQWPRSERRASRAVCQWDQWQQSDPTGDDARSPIGRADSGHAYVAQVPATRPVTDYTARIIPHCAGVAVPLEVDPILWQR